MATAGITEEAIQQMIQWLLHWLHKLPLIDRTWLRKQLVFNVLLLLLLHPLQLLQLLRRLVRQSHELG